MAVGDGLYMYNVVVKSSRSLSHLLMSLLSFSVHGFLDVPVPIFAKLPHDAVCFQIDYIIWVFISAP